MRLPHYRRFFIGLFLIIMFAALWLAQVFELTTSAARYLWAHDYRAAAYYLNNTDGDLAFQMGQYYFGGGAYDLDKAAKSYQLALEQQPGMLWGHYQRARIYFVQGKFEKALQEIEAELEANPANLRSLYVRGLIYLSADDLFAAEADFKAFVAWAPTEWGGYNDLAFVLAKEGKYAESEVVIMEAMQKVPNAKDIPWLWNSLGLAQLNRLHYTDAAASFAKALALAEGVTAEDWRRAYSGNNPQGDEDGVHQFRQTIEKNLRSAQLRGTL